MDILIRNHPVNCTHVCLFAIHPMNHFLFEQMENKDYSCCMRECYSWITALTSADGQCESIVTVRILSKRSRCHIQGNSTILNLFPVSLAYNLLYKSGLVIAGKNDQIIHYHLSFSLPGRNYARISSNVVWKWSWTGNRVCERACSG